MFKTVSSLLLLVGFTASLKVQNLGGPDIFQKHDADDAFLLDLMIQTGARDHDAAHLGKLGDKDRVTHDHQIDEVLASAVRQSIGKMKNLKLDDTVSGKYGLVWVHGAGFYNWKPLFDKYLPSQQSRANLSVTFPKAPNTTVTAWGAGATKGVSWFNMEFMPIGKDDHPTLYGCSLEDAQKNTAIIHQSIKALEMTGVPSENIVVAGMSQGGYMAMRAALTYPKKLGGAFNYAGMLINPDELTKSATTANKDIPIHWLHGSEDDVLFSSLQEVGVQQLKTAGFKVEKSTCHAHHTSHPALYEKLGQFINKLMLNKQQLLNQQTSSTRGQFAMLPRHA
jgi:phospholipase/carboxylesterase